MTQFLILMESDLEHRYSQLEDSLFHLQSRKRNIDQDMLVVKKEMEVLKSNLITEYQEDGVCPANYVVSKVAPKPIVTDEDSLPDRFIRIKKEVDKTAINKAIKAGEQIEGVVMSNGGYTIKRKGK